MMNLFFLGIAFSYIFVSSVIIFVAILIFLIIYENYVSKNSLCLKRIDELNNYYSFKELYDLNFTHKYDNENIYLEISPKDYLTYQLQFIKKDVRQAIFNSQDNKSKYSDYLYYFNCVKNEIYDYDDVKLKFLFKYYERKFAKKSLKKPTTSFYITVTLYLTNMNGYIRDKNRYTFNEKEIYELLYMLDKKNGNYYLNHEIWKSICRVERGKITNKMRFLIYSRDNYCCQICGRRTDDLEIDHIYPISKGGKSTLDNLQTLCRKCNKEKGSRIL